MLVWQQFSKLSAILWIAFLILPSSSQVEAASLTKLHHSVYLGGLYLGGVTTKIREEDGSYRIETSADSNDTFSWMFEWIAKAESEGAVKNGIVAPAQHSHESKWNKKTRTANINFQPDGKVFFHTTGKPYDNPKKYVLLDPDTVHDSLDPMSAMLQVSSWLSEGRGCQGKVPVFDGRRRYDIRFSETPMKMISKSDYSVFRGLAQGCKIEVDKIGGFKRELSDFEKRQQEIVIWVAQPLEGGPFVPVNVTVNTGLGALVMHLDLVKRGAVQLVSKNYN